jgi:hypothetical protein
MAYAVQPHRVSTVSAGLAFDFVKIPKAQPALLCLSTRAGNPSSKL